MKAYLHGGFDLDEYNRTLFFKQLEKIFEKEKITQVLHIPFARAWVRDTITDWPTNRFSSYFPDIKFLDAKFKEHIDLVDIEKVFIIMTWWSTWVYLTEFIHNYAPLEMIVKNAKWIFWSSAWMKALWTKYHKNWTYHEWLGLINYIWEAHYSQYINKWKLERNVLQVHIEKFNIDYSIGIEKDTIVEIIDWKIGDTRWEGKSYIIEHQKI